MVIRKRFNKLQFWCCFSFKQFGLGIKGTSLIPFGMIEYLYEVEIDLLFLKAVISFEK